MPADGAAPPLDALADHVTPIDDGERTDADASLADVLQDAADATVVGIGEPGHGIRDCHRLQRRIVQSLIRERGLRAVAVETNYSEATAIDAYVRHADDAGTDAYVRDPDDAASDAADEALSALSMWVWATEGWRALLEWLREFNRGRPAGDQVRFYGVDVQRTTAPAARVRDYLERVDPDFRESRAEALDLLEAGVRPGNRDGEAEPPADDVLEARIERAAAAVDAIEARFADRRAEYVAASGERAYEVAVGHVAQLEPAVDLARIAHEDGAGVAYGARRDAAMAENVARVLDRDDHDALAVVAANGHLRKGNGHRDDPDDGGPVGYHLDDAFGEDYYVVAAEFGTGAARTLERGDDGVSFPAQAFADPPPNSLPGALAELTDEPAVLDVATATERPELDDWLSTVDSHGFAPLYDPDAGAGLAGDWRLDWSWEVDACWFLPSVEAATLLAFVTDDE